MTKLEGLKRRCRLCQKRVERYEALVKASEHPAALENNMRLLREYQAKLDGLLKQLKPK